MEKKLVDKYFIYDDTIYRIEEVLEKEIYPIVAKNHYYDLKQVFKFYDIEMLFSSDKNAIKFLIKDMKKRIKELKKQRGKV